jgi:tRNA(Ile)-lysidine synthase
MEEVFAGGGQWPGAVAVSGGADSLALLLLLAGWAADAAQAAPIVLTVDHGLQPDSRNIAQGVVRRARALHLTAHVLRWTGRKPVADIESAAREARYRLMGNWCRRHGINCLYVAHSQDDQAETFLLRLMRGSGVDGLAAMTVVAPFPAVSCGNLRIARPLLRVPRAKLRSFLAARGEGWSEDEMNADPRFARVRLRKAWPVLQEIGFSTERIAAAAQHLGRARATLDQAAAKLLACACRREGAQVFLDGLALASAPEEIAFRALARVLMDVSGRFYRPRFERLERLAVAVRSDDVRGGRTLHGCCIRPASKRDACFGPQTLRIVREGRPDAWPKKCQNPAGRSDVKLSKTP